MPHELPLAGRHVAVLMGGLSAEREVSLVSGAACADALERLGARVSRVDAGRDIAAVLTALEARRLLQRPARRLGRGRLRPGRAGDPGPCPTPTPGVLASALAMDKAKAKAVMAAAGVPVPGGGLFNRFEAGRATSWRRPMWSSPTPRAPRSGVFLVFEGANGPPQELLAPVLDLRRRGDDRALCAAVWSWRWRSWATRP